MIRRLQGLINAILLACGVAFVVWLLVTHPKSPLPRQWNPTERLVVSDPVTWLTTAKLRSAVRNHASCKAVLQEAGAQFDNLGDLEESTQCYILGRVELRRVGEMSMAPVQTSCAIALRLAMWERHGLQPSARSHLGANVTSLLHQSSYNCRQIRNGRSMSLHATAEVIDVSGFRFSDGRQLHLRQDWDGAGNAGQFLRDIRDSSCRWFVTTLGPEYNALHADHFHLQSAGWGTCR